MNPLNASSINSDNENSVELSDKRSRNDILENNTTSNGDSTLEFPDFWIKLAGLELKPEGLWKILWYFWRIVILINTIMSLQIVIYYNTHYNK